MTAVLRANTFEEASHALAAEPGAALVGGGTDLVPDIRSGRRSPSLLVDLTSIRPRNDEPSKSGIWVSTLTRVRQLETSVPLLDAAAALVEAARVLGSIQIRTMATIGGNLCNASPAADLAPALLVHAATAHIIGPSCRRQLPLSEFFIAPRETVLSHSEILVGVEIPVPSASSGSSYMRQTVRWAMDLAGVGVAAFVEVADETITSVRVALGAVAPTPILVGETGSLLAGRPLAAGGLMEAGRIAAEIATPLTDARGPAGYRRKVISALVPRVIRLAYARATKGATREVGSPDRTLLPERPTR